MWISDSEIRNEALEIGFRAKSGELPRKLIVPTFALVQEASYRAIGLRHYDVQLLAGINLVNKCIVEMATGEGKTLTALLPLTLFGFYGKGSHLATANDYLARRDAQEMKSVFESLGLSVGMVQHTSTDEERKLAYQSDITYGTLAEFGFDFLRDRMKCRYKEVALRESQSILADSLSEVTRRLHFVLVDEADSIMIDDASTPLIIGAHADRPKEKSIRLYTWAANHAPIAVEGRDFRYIEYRKKVELTERGRELARELATNSIVRDLPSVDAYEYLERAIKVERNYIRDKHYVVREGEVTIVDENTGRLAVGRFWQDGLHQAIQARERVEITTPTATAARLTVQSLVLSFPNRAGMTGTAKSSKREFRKVYKMNVVTVPTNKLCVREQLETKYHRDFETKLHDIRDTVVRLRAAGRPVLIGSRSVSKSESLSLLFAEAGISHKVLNARNEPLEAEIVAKAGQANTVTISTNMAGRGTDIKIPDDVANAGGLHVLMTELNDSRRIDRQLIGRCARQGDPGTYQVFLCNDDHVFDPINKTQIWAALLRWIPLLPRIVFFRGAQGAVDRKKRRERLAMLFQEKKRLRALRQAGIDPVLDVVG